MKKIFIGLMALALAFTAAVSLTGCGPTAGLDELTLDEIASANMSGTYTCVVETKTYNSDGSLKNSSTSDPVEKSAATVKLEMAGMATTIGLVGTATSSAKGRVCANSKFTKIVIYVYTKDSDGRITAESITTYKKI
jgi:hypothetical protein